MTGAVHHATTDGQLSHVPTLATNTATRRTTLNGREYVVAEDVTAVKSMILKEKFLPKRAIKRAAPGFNGVPLPVGHPQDGEQFVSANTPDRIARYSVGRFFNVSAEDDGERLVGDLYIDVEKSEQLAAERHERLGKPLRMVENGEPLAVSTAYYYDEETNPGTHDGEAYQHVQRNLLPDHLALLPESDGECGLEDSCGVNPDAAAANAALTANCGGDCDCQAALSDDYAQAALALAETSNRTAVEWLDFAVENSLSAGDLRAVHRERSTQATELASVASNLSGGNRATDDPTRDDWATVASSLAGGGD